MKMNGKAIIIAGSIIASMVGGFILGCLKEKMMNNQCSCFDEF